MDFALLGSGGLGGVSTVVLRHDVNGQTVLGIVGIHLARGNVSHHLLDFFERDVGEKFEPVLYNAVSQAVYLVVHHVGRLIQAHVVTDGLTHLDFAVGTQKDRHEKTYLRFHTFEKLQVATAKHVELLVGATKFHIAIDGHRIVTLHHGVHEFVEADGRIGGVAVVEVLAFQHLGHSKLAHEFGHLAERKLREPFSVVVDFHLVAADHLKELFLVFLGILQHLFVAEARTGLVAAAGVANLSCVVAHDENNRMPQVLELAKLAHHDSMAKMHIWSRGVHTHLHTERHTGIIRLLEFLFKFILRHNINNTAHQNFKLFFYGTELHFRI